VRNAQRIEAQRVRPDSSDARRISEEGKSFDLDADLLAKTKAILGTRQTYGAPSLCVFEPRIKLVFHTANEIPVTFLLCLKCADIRVERGEGKQIGFASFSPAMAEVEALAKQMFPNDDAINYIIKNRETENRSWAEKEAHWRDRMPESIRPLWNDVLRSNPIYPETKRLDAALVKGIPDESERILALLAWYGSGSGPWTGYPAYEEVAAQMLARFPADKIVATVESRTLTKEQLEGTARYFAGFNSVSGGKRVQDLPASLKKMLLEEVLQSGDADKIERAKRAFEK
jgi:hypothetical protein